MKRICFVFLLFLFLTCPFLYASSFLEISKNNKEAYFLQNSTKVSFEDSLLLSSGILDLTYYKQKLEKHYFILENQTKNMNDKQKAKYIFDYLHKYVFKKYNISATTIQDVLDRGLYNCLSATAIYHLFLERFDFHPYIVLFPTHMRTQLLLENGKVYEIENTLKEGFTYSQNEKLKKQFEKLTGFSDNSLEKSILEDRKLPSLMYYNRSILASLQKNYDLSFQMMLRAYALEDSSKLFEQSLLNSYANEVTSKIRQDKMDLAMAIGEEGLIKFQDLKDEYLEGYTLLYQNYVAAFTNVLADFSSGQNIDIEKAYQMLNENTFLKEEDKTKLYKQLLIDDALYLIHTDLEKAYNLLLGKQNLFTDKEIYNTLINQGLLTQIEHLEKDIYHFEENKKKAYDWYNLSKTAINKTNMIALYNKIALLYSYDQQFDLAIFTLEEGMKNFGNDKTLYQNILYFEDQKGLFLFKKQDYENAIKVYKDAYQKYPNKLLLQSLRNMYLLIIQQLIHNDDKDHAKIYYQKALQDFPNDNKIYQLKEFL